MALKIKLEVSKAELAQFVKLGLGIKESSELELIIQPTDNENNLSVSRLQQKIEALENVLLEMASWDNENPIYPNSIKQTLQKCKVID